MEELTIEEIENTIEVIEDQIEFEKKYNKLVSSESFVEIFDKTIFGSELKKVSEELCFEIDKDREDYLLNEMRNIKLIKKYINDRKVHFDFLNDRLSEANRMRNEILKNTKQ